MKVTYVLSIFLLVILDLSSALTEGSSVLMDINKHSVGSKQSRLKPKEKSFNSYGNGRKHPDQGLSVPELISKYHYPLEIYDVETEDGYVLTVHRIPYGRNTKHKSKKVVFIMHGLLCSSADWVMMGPEKGLAYILADRGFDVWLGNARGNKYSRKHKSYDPDVDTEKFWNFSWHEIGYYDLPAMIDFALQKTGKEKLHYIGHSQGTTSFFVMASERPEYNKKVQLMQALSPVVYMKNMPYSFLGVLAALVSITAGYTKDVGFSEILPNDYLTVQVGQMLCNDDAIFQEVCANVLFLIAGRDITQLNKTMIPVILSNVPAGASYKQVIHYVQGMISGDFKKYDYGAFHNLYLYGFRNPPKYNLDNVNVPIALYYGGQDNFTGEKDILKLYRILQGNVIGLKKISSFNHLDFLWAIDAPSLLYEDVIYLMEHN